MRASAIGAPVAKCPSVARPSNWYAGEHHAAADDILHGAAGHGHVGGRENAHVLGSRVRRGDHCGLIDIVRRDLDGARAVGAASRGENECQHRRANYE